MNAPAKVSKDGQVTLPQDVLVELGVENGGDVTLGRTADGRVTIEKANATQLAPIRWDKLRGHAGPGLTTDEIMEMTRGPFDDVDRL